MKTPTPSDAAIEGDVRIIRGDDKNFEVQQYRSIAVKENRRGGKYTGEVREDWTTVAYYGERPGDLILACKFALAKGARGNDTKELAQTVIRAEKAILASLEVILKEIKNEN